MICSLERHKCSNFLVTSGNELQLGSHMDCSRCVPIDEAAPIEHEVKRSSHQPALLSLRISPISTNWLETGFKLIDLCSHLHKGGITVGLFLVVEV